MLSHTTWLISKMDPVKYIFEKPALTGRLAQWQVLLSEFDIVYVTQKAIKGSALADYLAQQPLNDYQPMHPEFPDEDIMYIFEKPALTGRIARWQVLLSEFDIVYVTQKAIKGSALADYLAQQPLNDYQPMHPEFPDEDIMALFEEKLDEDQDKWTVWFDEASNILGHGVGAVLISPDNQCVPFTAKLGFDCTNTGGN